MPPAKNWLRFSGSIPPLFVLSPNMPTINTPSKLASFWRFCNAVGSLPCDSLATVLPPRLMLHPHAPRLTPHQRVQAGQRPPPAGYCHPPTPELPKTERAPISTSGPSVSVCHRIGRSLRASQSFPPRSPPLNRGAEWATYFLPQGKRGWPQRPTFTGTGRACGKEKSRKPEFSERNGPPTFCHPGNAGGPTSPWALFSRSTLGVSSSTPHDTLGRGCPKADAGTFVVAGLLGDGFKLREW